VAIDFGCAFDQGSQLPVPELIPFRFTRGFRELLQPLGRSGLVYYPMVAALHCLRDKRSKIYDVASIFVDEPLMEWTARIRGQEEDIVSAAVKARVDVTDLKLQGCRPGIIIAAALGERSAENKKLMINAVCRSVGMPSTMPLPMARLLLADEAKPHLVSEGDQARELIRLATDDALLARHYQGMRMWY